jgi:sugar phosphate isomerase/epimerase
MKFSASNIAWSFAERFDAYDLLRRAGFTGVEIAPGLFFEGEADVFLPSEHRISSALAEVAAAGLQITSMQALLFGVQGAALFGTEVERESFTDAMHRAIALAGRLGVPNLVFGSPRQRLIPPDMSRKDAMKIAIDTFRRLGSAAQAVGCRIAIEPNPAEYGTNFLNRQAEAEAFLDLVDHPAICGIIDSGALLMNAEALATLSVKLSRIGHVHCSAPQLAPAPISAEAAQGLLAKLLALGYDGVVSIEMKRAPKGVADLEQSVDTLASAARALGLIGQE